jgi:hypothetical protein
MNKPTIVRSIIRTVIVPLLAGYVLVGVTGAPLLLASLVAFVWYVGVRLLEIKFPKAGWLLGWAGAPSYEDTQAWLASLKRTLVPLLVSFAAAFALKNGLDISQSQLEALITTIITSAYYGIIRKVEQTKPAAGALIGGVGTPTYK